MNAVLSIRYVKFILYLVICMNWISCAVFLCACPPTLISFMNDWQVTTLPHGQTCVKNSWLHDSLENNNATLADLYTTSAYFAIVTFTSVGFGEFHAENPYEVRRHN